MSNPHEPILTAAANALPGLDTGTVGNIAETVAAARSGITTNRDSSSPGAPQEWVCHPGEFARLPERPYQELWFELRTWGWKSLAIVPTRPGTSEFDVAERLVVVGVSNTNRPMSLISAEGVTIADTDRTVAMIRAAEARGERVVVIADSIHDNPASAPVIRAVNGTVLVVRLGDSSRRDVEKTVNAVGRNRVIGVVTRED
jgi:hypothetical protein